MPLLPLFPLGTVLAPGADLPLRVFEPRYLQLLADVVGENASAEPEFGVVAIRRGHEVGTEREPLLHEVGTVARIVRGGDLEDGRWLVLCRGTTRFAVERLAPEAGTPYLTAAVSLLGEPDGDGPLAALCEQLRAETSEHLRATGSRAQLPDDPLAVSHAVGEVLGLPLGDRQELLAASDTTTRLRLALRLLRRERGLLATFGALPGAPSGPPNPN